MGFLAPAMPFIMKGGAALLGGLLGKKMQGAAMERSPEEQAALTGATSAAGTLRTTGENQIGMGTSALSPALSYYQRLLGSRQSAQAAVAPATENIQQDQQGTANYLQRVLPRGGVQDQAQADLARQGYGARARLFAGVQPGAAGALGTLGTEATRTGAQMVGGSANIFQSLLGQGFQNRKYGREEGQTGGTAIGGALFDILKHLDWKKLMGGGGDAPTGLGEG